jgi:hypothetical protein
MAKYSGRQSTNIQDLRKQTAAKYKAQQDAYDAIRRMKQAHPPRPLIDATFGPSIVGPFEGGVATEHRQIPGAHGYRTTTGDLLRGLLSPVSEQYSSGVGARFRREDVGPYETLEAKPQAVFIPETIPPRPRTPKQQEIIDENWQGLKDIMTGLREGKVIAPLAPLERVPTPPRPRPGGRPPFQEPHKPARLLLEGLK